MHNALLDSLTDYPFQRLRDLLDPVEPAAGLAPIALTVGEPQHAPPALLNQVLAENGHLWNKYPPTPGTPDLCAAIAEWLTRRYHLPDGFVDPTRHVLPVAGTREALYLIAQTVISRRQDGRQPVVLLPNPLYQAYLGGAVMAGADTTARTTTTTSTRIPTTTTTTATTTTIAGT
ncbi:MAG: aminotransferase class I/II-fold pyridoxal phosphate-dependent enzyme, partial [Magnetospiraceae bacterium]